MDVSLPWGVTQIDHIIQSTGIAKENFIYQCTFLLGLPIEAGSMNSLVIFYTL